MKERNEKITIFKSNDPEKIIVPRAASLQNEIRFYLNNTQYIAAVECEEGCLIKFEEESKKCKKKGKKNITGKELKEIIKIIFIYLVISILGFSLLICLCKITNNLLVLLLSMNIVIFILDIMNVIIMEAVKTDFSIRSKHSAEHMMVNFLETNKRLPKSMEEIKKTSRFSFNCGSRELVEKIVQDFIRSIVATIFIVIIVAIAIHMNCNPAIIIIVMLLMYYLIKYVVGKVITKYEALNFIIEPIIKLSTCVVQLSNTTSKVKDEDIVLAYLVAKKWLRIVYPELYNEKEDILKN